MNLFFLLAQTGDGAGDVAGAVETSGRAMRDALQEAFNAVASFLPNTIGALLILLVGYFVARLLGRGTSALAETFGLHRAADRSGLSESMQRVGINRDVPAILGLLVFWLLMAVAIMAAFNLLQLKALSDAMQQVVEYIPRVLAAAVVIVVGLLLASFLRRLISSGADQMGLSYAEPLANICYWVLAVTTIITAIEQLKIEILLPKQLILIAFAALGVGFALAFGLGGRDVMGGILAGYYIRQRFQAGDKVRIGEMKGTVREATIVETEEGGMLHRHSVPNALMLKEGIR